MLKKNIYIIASVCLAVISLQFQSCKKQDTPTYDSGNYLHFDRVAENKQRIDTAYFSFSHHPGEDKVTRYFKVSLIGQILTEDKEYEVVVLNGDNQLGVPYTTAKEGQYKVPEKLIFRKGVLSDSLTITVFRDKVSEGEEYYVTLRLISNDNFGVGYYQNTDIKLRFDNKLVTPIWWTNEIRIVYFGEFSEKKLETIILANPGFTSVEGMNGTEMTKVALKTKAYIREHGVVEENGDPMVLPIN